MASLCESSFWQKLLLFVVVILRVSCDARLRLNLAILSNWNDAIISDVIKNEMEPHQPISIQNFDMGVVYSHYNRMEAALHFLKTKNIHIVLGPFDKIVSIATEQLNVTYIVTTEVTSVGQKSIFQILPDIDYFAQASLERIKYYGWEKINIFYDDGNGMSVVHHLLTDPLLLMKVWRLDNVASQNTIREYLIKIRQSSVKRSVIICSEENVRHIIRQAFSLSMLSTPHEWFFYDPYNELYEALHQFPDLKVNFTVFTLVDQPSNVPDQTNGIKPSVTNDVVTLLLEVTRQPMAGNDPQTVRNELLDRMINANVIGKTGILQFNQVGKRINTSIFLQKITAYSTTKIGEWNDVTDGPKLNIISDADSSGNSSTLFPLSGRTVKVVTILEKPHCMLKRDHKVRHGNDKFEGFVIDLLREVADMLDFDYQIYLVHDGKFGSKRANESWDGMIGELLAGNASMIAAPLSINSDRENVIDFTNPFMTRHISTLIQVPKSETSYFDFLKPLHPIVWFCILGAVIFTGACLFILERIRPFDNHQRAALSFKESLWFLVCSLFRGNTNKFPSTVPGRLMASFWWIFVLVLITSYTANLTAFLTVKKIETPVNSVHDLAIQSKLKFGTVKNSGVMNFFKTTDLEIFQTLLKQMSDRAHNALVNSSEEGFRKVKTESYAFFWDSSVNSYLINEDCDLMEIGSRFGPKGFGFAAPSGSTFRDELSLALLKLGDLGQLQELESRWWKKLECPGRDQDSSTETQKLRIDDVAGVFFILACGVIAAASVCLVQFSIRQIATRLKMGSNHGNESPTPDAMTSTNDTNEAIQDSLS